MNEVCLFRETVCLESKRSLVEYINAQYAAEKRTENHILKVFSTQRASGMIHLNLCLLIVNKCEAKIEWIFFLQFNISIMLLIKDMYLIKLNVNIILLLTFFSETPIIQVCYSLNYIYKCKMERPKFYFK